MDLQNDIRKIEEGWSSKFPIINRAVIMRSHLNGGNNQRAEELAHEIYFLQEAAASRKGKDFDVSPPDRDEWVIDNRIWAEFLIGGAYRVTSFFPVPAGSDEHDALLQARRRFNHPFKLGDIRKRYDLRLTAGPKVAAE